MPKNTGQLSLALSQISQHIVEILPRELIDMLRTVRADVDTDFFCNRYCLGPNTVPGFVPALSTVKRPPHYAGASLRRTAIAPNCPRTG